MSIAASPLDSAGSAGGIDRLVRNGLFLATFLLTWLTLAPFPDMGDPALLDPVGEGHFAGQVAMLLLTAALAAFVATRDARIAASALTSALVLTFAWFAVSAVLSAYPGLAARRVVLAGLVVFQAVVFLLLAENREHFARLLAVGALIILATCYLGVLLAPGLSVHQLTDVREPELAGAWRGPFAHKNGAGAGMALLVFVGIFVSRSWSVFAGIAIVALAAIFLVFTQAKSPLGLLPLVLLLAFVVPRLRSPSMKLAAVVGVPLVLNLLTIGSVRFDAVYSFVSAISSDPSYTGRDVIWRFTLDHIAQRPLAGFGFQAFWGTSELADGSILESWGYRASDAHNGYLNVAVMTGLVGLGLCLVWVVGQAFADLNRAKSSDPALTALYLQIWLFGLCLSAFESVLFSNGSGLWFMMVMAVVGFRFQSIGRVVR